MTDQSEYPTPPESCSDLWNRLLPDRDNFLRRAREACKLTLPWLIPEAGHSSANSFATPFQSMGAQGTNNLASKLMMALFPPNTPFFKFQVEPFVAETVTQNEDAKQEIEKNLILAEETVEVELESSGWRVRAYEGMQHLVPSGNFLVHWPEKQKARIFHLDQFVIERDPMGKPIHIITNEQLAKSTLPPEVAAALMENPSEAKASEPGASGVTAGRSEQTYDLKTHCWYDNDADRWHTYQEVSDIHVNGSEETYTTEAFPYIPVRGNHISGENYGRGYVEDYLGDLLSLEGLTQAVVEGSAAAARVLFMVNPNGTTDINTLADKPNGAFAEGNFEDVHALQLDKFADFQIAANTASAIETRLARAFLLNSSIQRQAERVTAEEIRYMAQELESALGGVYSLLSLELQLPLINLLVYRLNKDGRLPKLEKRLIKPSIVTGIEALGRGNDLNRLREAIATLKDLIGPDAAAQFLNLRNIAVQTFTAAGVSAKGLVKEQAEMDQQAQQGQMQAMIEKLGPHFMQMMQKQQEAGAAPATA